MRIKKRDNSIEEFNLDKILTAVGKCFKAVGTNETPRVIKEYLRSWAELTRNSPRDIITVEEVQDTVENLLMKYSYYKAAKSYILYRDQHKKDRDTLQKLDFMIKYSNASNAASGSKYDANANVENKNITTLMGELPKGDYIRLNRKMLYNKIRELYDTETADKYLHLLENHFVYKNDETSLANYCASITMYPWLLEGTKSIGGNSDAPTNLKSFCGGFINMVFMVSSMLSGACATPEFLMYLDYFIRKEYGDDYYEHPDKVVDLSLKQRTIDKVITDCFEQIVYSLNQPTGARNFQAVFWNIAYYDEYYFKSLFEDFVFPDTTKPSWEGTKWLQKRFMNWFNQERLKKVLTFPVETSAMLYDPETKEYLDKDWSEFAAEMYSEGHSFFTYISDNADSLSSCCRLRNAITDNTFSYTLGAGGISTGSKSVLTINVNRCVQYAKKHNINYREYFKEVVELCHKAQIAYNENLKTLKNHGLLPLFDAGYINMSRQYLTIGVNGIVEAAESMYIDITPNPTYANFVSELLSIVEENNMAFRNKELMFNCEMIPAESVGVKHAKWDKEDGYLVPRDCYNSYFYKVEDENISILDKMTLHGKEYIEHLTGGSALHLNLEEHLSKLQYLKLFKIAADKGCNYFTFNVPNTICNDCGYITKHRKLKCPKCGSKNIDYVTRIIGYLKRVSNFSQGRQSEANKRFYNTKKDLR